MLGGIRRIEMVFLMFRLFLCVVDCFGERWFRLLTRRVCEELLYYEGYFFLCKPLQYYLAVVCVWFLVSSLFGFFLKCFDMWVIIKIDENRVFAYSFVYLSAT